MLGYHYHYVIAYYFLFNHLNYTNIPCEAENYANNNKKPVTFISLFYLYNIFTKSTMENNVKCLILRTPLGIKVKIKLTK